MLKQLRELLGRRGKKKSEGRTSVRSETAGTGVEERPDPPAPAVHVGPRVVHRPIPESDLDPDAVKIIRRLTRFDHTAYLVGGCVRDLLLDLKPKDYDIGTSATPRQIKRLFRNCRIIGRRFRLAHIYFQKGKVIEVATFRARDEDDPETDGGDLLIRDDNVFGTAEQDALRRDFTVNSLFYDLNNETVLDHCAGLDDLRRKLVRTIGDPEIRFREDPIRILRAIKFAARLDFRIESRTLDRLEQLRTEVPKAAAPRILEEINRFCQGGAARRSFELLRETGIFEIILPEFHELYDVAPTSWRQFLSLVDQIDRRLGQGKETGTGEILVLLLLPVIFERIGWKEGGEAVRPKGVNVRELADAIVKPMAVRLRVSRKDQEHCRQILMSLYRMVPVKKLRSNTRRAIVGRESFPGALWILEAVADLLGGDFTAAVSYWKKAAEPPAPGTGTAAGEEKPARSRRRRRPRKGAGSGKPAGKKTEQGGGGKKKPAAKQADMPPPWDDRYFFAALPTVPDGEAEESKPRETAAEVEEPVEDAPPRPKRKRRRRRRRRKPSGSSTAGDSGKPAGSK